MQKKYEKEKIVSFIEKFKKRVSNKQIFRSSHSISSIMTKNFVLLTDGSMIESPTQYKHGECKNGGCPLIY